MAADGPKHIFLEEAGLELEGMLGFRPNEKALIKMLQDLNISAFYVGGRLAFNKDQFLKEQDRITEALSDKFQLRRENARHGGLYKNKILRIILAWVLAEMGKNPESGKDLLGLIQTTLEASQYKSLSLEELRTLLSKYQANEELREYKRGNPGSPFVRGTGKGSLYCSRQ